MSGTVQLPPDSTGKIVDTSQLTVSATTVQRQNIVVADPATAANLAGVTAKGTQAAFALGIQSLADSGRNPITLFADAATCVTTEALISIVQWKGGTSTTATNFTVTAGKTFRVTNFTFCGRQTTTTILDYKARLRFVTSGTVATTSAVAMAGETSGFAATNPSGSVPWTAGPDSGYELAAGYNYGVCQTCSATTGTITVCITGYEY